MVIRQIEQTPSGVYKLTPESGSAFFLRDRYLRTQEAALLISRMTCRLSAPEEALDLPVAEDLLYASLCYAAEAAALSYLARAEHCRAALTRKLLAKNIDKEAVTRSLDFLEEAGYLDDFRFAGAWLRNRSIDHAEGRSRLSAELASRGVRRDDARRALDEYFADKDEDELCRRALQKLVRRKTPQEKLYTSLARLGFSSAEIRSALQE